MAIDTFRARSGTEIIDAAFQLVKSHYAPLVTIAAIGFLPLLVVELLTGGGATMIAKPGVIVVTGLVNAVTTFIMQGALVVAIADAYRGIPIDIARSLQQGATKLWPMFVASLIAGFLASIGFILLIVPGLFVLAWLFVVPVVVMVENVSPLQALSRSRELGRDHKRRVFAYMLVMLAIYIICAIILGVLSALTRSLTVAAFANLAVLILVWPLYPAFMVLHYYDARIRKEGYDVELLAQSMSAPATLEPMAP